MLRERLEGGAAGRANVEELRRKYMALQDEAMVRVGGARLLQP